MEAERITMIPKVPDIKEIDKSVKGFLSNNRVTIIATVVMIAVVMQSFFMYETTKDKKKTSFVVFTSSPHRFIARWDENDKYLDQPVVPGEQIGKIISEILKYPFQDYKFNENIYIRLNTLDAKSDDATIKIDESQKTDNTVKTPGE